MKTQQKQIILNQSGFTIVEVFIAVAVFSIGFLAANVMQVSSINRNSMANRITTGTSWAADRVESLIGTDYTPPAGTTCANDPTNDEASPGYWLCDDDGNGTAGLDVGTRVTDCCPGDGCAAPLRTADGCFSSDSYTIHWNVAQDFPLLNLKTVRVITTYDQDIVGYEDGNAIRRQTVINYIKAENI